METAYEIKMDMDPMPDPPAVSQEDLDLDPMGGAIANYLHFHRSQHGESTENTMAANYRLLEPLPSNIEGQKKEKPALTICIPVAINREDPATITRVLDVVSAAQQKFGKPVEVVLWANAKYRDAADEEAVSMEALTRYDSLRTNLSERQDAGLEIQTALQIKPQVAATMGQIRANYMEAVALDAKERGLGYDHPVMWLDADAVDISDKTFEQVVDKVQSFEELFVHPMTHYGIDWTDGRPLSEADAATKTVAIDEIMRRQKARNEVREAQSNLDMYHEENGLAFAIGTYLSIGGLPAHANVNESKELIYAAQRHTDDARRYYTRLFGTYEVPVGVGILPQSIANRITKVPEGVLYLPGSYTTMAARKQNSRVRSEGPHGLKDIWTKKYKGLYVDQEGVDAEWSDNQIGDALPGYIQAESKDAVNLTDQQKVILGKLVTRYFESADGSQEPSKAPR